jgi:hypothetical protein
VSLANKGDEQLCSGDGPGSPGTFLGFGTENDRNQEHYETCLLGLNALAIEGLVVVYWLYICRLHW